MGGPVRVLHAVVNMNRGGAETLIMNMYRNINRSNVQFDFLTSKEGEFDQEIKQLGGKVHRIPYVTEAGHLGYLRALDQFFAAHNQYPIVHAHMDKMSGWVLRAAKRAGVAVRIAHSHNTSSEGGRAARLYKWFSGRQIPLQATHSFACSNAAANWLFHSQRDVVIMQNGIDMDKFAYSAQIRKQMREALDLPLDSMVVGHVGRFTPQKNHSFLMDVFANLLKKHPKAVLVLAGDGFLRQDMERKARKLKLDQNVKFLGIRKDVDRIFQAFDMFVFPSLHEGLPVTLVEAQGAGLPCLISDTITKEVDLGLGLVTCLPLHEPTRWAEEIVQQTKKHTNRTYNLDRLAQRGFDIKQTAKWMEEYYLAQDRGVWNEDINRVYAHV